MMQLGVESVALSTLHQCAFVLAIYQWQYHGCRFYFFEIMMAFLQVMHLQLQKRGKKGMWRMKPRKCTNINYYCIQGFSLLLVSVCKMLSIFLSWDLFSTAPSDFCLHIGHGEQTQQSTTNDILTSSKDMIQHVVWIFIYSGLILLSEGKLTVYVSIHFDMQQSFEFS